MNRHCEIIQNKHRIKPRIPIVGQFYFLLSFDSFNNKTKNEDKFLYSVLSLNHDVIGTTSFAFKGNLRLTQKNKINMPLTTKEDPQGTYGVIEDKQVEISISRPVSFVSLYVKMRSEKTFQSFNLKGFKNEKEVLWINSGLLNLHLLVHKWIRIDSPNLEIVNKLIIYEGYDIDNLKFYYDPLKDDKFKFTEAYEDFLFQMYRTRFLRIKEIVEKKTFKKMDWVNKRHPDFYNYTFDDENDENTWKQPLLY